MFMSQVKQRVRAVVTTARKLHEDEQGAEGLEKLLIVAAVVLPLLGLLIFFRDELAQWVRDTWENIKSQGDQQL
jgi:Flp pilus assembly pilin Flp